MKDLRKMIFRFEKFGILEVLPGRTLVERRIVVDMDVEFIKNVERIFGNLILLKANLKSELGSFYDNYCSTWYLQNLTTESTSNVLRSLNMIVDLLNPGKSQRIRLLYEFLSPNTQRKIEQSPFYGTIGTFFLNSCLSKTYI